MIEDKLDREERIRLECINQAVASSGMGPSAEHIIDKASKYEKYILNGKANNGS